MKIRLYFICLLFFLIANLSFSQFKPYVPQVPIRASVEVGIYKQNLYNQRTAWIQQEINRLVGVYENLFNERKLPADFETYKHKINLRKVLTDFIDSIRYYDYSDNYYFNYVVQNFEAIEKYYYDYYNNEVKRYNNRN